MSEIVMVNKKTFTQLSVAHGTINGQPHVIACGYDQTGSFGYFICTETIHPGTPVCYEYANFVSFTKKHNEGTFQQVLKHFGTLVG